MPPHPIHKGESAKAALHKIFTLNAISPYFSGATLMRAGTYWTKGRVRNLQVAADFTSITARVAGSVPEPYRQTIVLEARSESRIYVNGCCTCPQAYNCKHVAAVLLAALAAKPEAKEPQAESQPLPFEVKTWLEDFAQPVSGDDYPPQINQRLLYLIQPQALPIAAPHLAVEIITARVLKSGAFSSSIVRPALYNFYKGDFPRYFRDVDVRICESLLALRGGYNHSSYSIKSLSLLTGIVQTGRAFWLTHQGKPLRMGEPRQGRIEWVMPDTKGMRPILKVEGAVALNAEPPIYVDAANALIGEVSLPLPHQLSHRLLTAPAIAPAHIEQVSKTLARHLPEGSGMVPKAPDPPIVVDEIPTPLLRLMLLKNPFPQYFRAPRFDLPVARLAFRYGQIEVPLGETSPVVETVLENRRYQTRRRPAKEKQAVDTLRSLDLRYAREVYSLIRQEFHKDLAFYKPDDWLPFLALVVPNLQEQGFGIRIDDDFPYRLARPSGDLDTEIFAGPGLDWFELALGIHVDGERMDLGPLLADLVLKHDLDPDALGELAQEGEDIYVPLKDGRHLALAAKRFLPVILALHEFALGGAVPDKDGRLRISKAETALLTNLEKQAGVSFKGLENLRRLVGGLSHIRAGDLAPLSLPADFNAVLRPYQAQGVAWLNLLCEASLGGILADDMGLGKTVQVLAQIAIEKAGGRLTSPALIVAPTSLMTNWQNEARKFAPGLTVLLLHGAARKSRFEEIRHHDVVLTTYPLIARDQAVLMEQPWHMAILDEAQTIKNPNAATTKLIRELKATHRFCLTGTPMENHLGELWSLMSFVNPGYLGDKTAFVRRWRTPIEKHADAGRSAVLSRRVRPFMLRRTKLEVASELPPKSEITESITLDDRQRVVYDSIRLSMHGKVRKAIAAKGFAKSHIIILEALLKLRQVCCDPRLLRLNKPDQTAQGAADASAPSAKMERLMEMLDSLLAEGRKIIVFSQFTSMLHLIRGRLEAADITFSLLTGETKDRKAAIEQFQAGRTNVFLVSLKAGGVGLNLTAADTVILYDPWWNPAVEQQAIDRAYRLGQDKPVFVYRLVAGQTIEQKMDELKARKRALAGSLFDQAGHPTAAFTEADLNELLGTF